MQRTMGGGIAPGEAPRVIRLVIAVTCIASIACSIIDAILIHLFSFPGLSTLLLASWPGLSHLFLWQPLTYLFIYGGGEPITLFWLLGLAMYMYILWSMGSHLVERRGEREFIALYLLSGAFAAVAALLFVPLIGQGMVLSGPTSSILAVMVAWCMTNPRSKLLLFFIIPIESRWLIAAILGAIVLINLSNFAIVPLLFYLAGALFSYFFCVARWKLTSPFQETHHFDRRVMQFFDDFSLPWQWRGRGGGSGKIYDINTGRSIDGDARFMDEMLDKISREGKDSLTWWERYKMSRISKRRKM